ncbi:hypothetical protein JW898_00635 [Candidatus Woesearchaeota archaeon]|nr:hypothetical protein [Candidatus Woesearchaeota archaeon]
MKYVIGIIAAILILMVAGCTAPTCYPPNKILGNKCCLDEDNNDVCDYEEQMPAVHEEESATEEPEPEEAEMTEEQEEPQIQQVKMPEAVEPAMPRTLELGKQQIRLGEPRKYLEINKLTAYRTSTDKGMMDDAVITVRNIGQKDLNAIVELFFEGARIEEYEAKVKKEYTIPTLKPGEKYVMKQSLGIRFAEIAETKTMTLSVYEKYIAPRKDLETLEKRFVPKDLFESMEIYTYGLPD